MSLGRAPLVHAAVLEVALPLLRPFVTGFGVTDTRHTVLVHIRDADGVEGWGEGPALDHPYYLPDTTTTTFEVIKQFALPLALEAGSVEPSAVAQAMSRIRGNTFARAAVEQSFWTLASASTGTPLAELIGGSAERVPVGESLSIAGTLEETLAEVALRVQEGYQRIKVKVQPGWDVHVVAAVRKQVGDSVILQVDANGAYSLADTEQLAALDDYDLACVEQPLEWDSLIEHAELQRTLRTPICLDESLRSVADVRRALALDACRNVNLKPARVGGITASLRIAELCAARGVPLWCGGMMESGIGRAANLALCSLPAFTQPADMSPASVLFAWDLVDPTYQVAPDGTIEVPSQPGVGFEVRLDRVEANTVRRTDVLDRSQPNA